MKEYVRLLTAGLIKYRLPKWISSGRMLNVCFTEKCNNKLIAWEKYFAELADGEE